MHCMVFDEVFKKGCENLNKWTRKPKVKNFVHLILKTRDYEDSAGMFRFLVSIHKKKGSGFEKITEKFGPIWRICQLKPLWLRFDRHEWAYLVIRLRCHTHTAWELSSADIIQTTRDDQGLFLAGLEINWIDELVHGIRK